MPRFTFKLEVVLRQRRRVEDEHQRALAQLLRERLILHTQLRTMQDTIRTDKQLMASALVGRVDVHRIRSHATHGAQVTQRAHGIVARLAALERQIESSRTQLLEATKARQAIELLRDRQRERFDRVMKRREAASLDEMAVQQFARQLGETAS